MERITDPRDVGRFFKERIKARGLLIKDVAEKISADPSYMSHLLSGRVSIVGSDYFRPLAKELELTVEEVKALDPNAVINFATDADQSAAPQKLMPPALLDAIKQFGELYPALRNPRVQEDLALVRRWEGSPKTAQEWLDFYLDNRRRFTGN